MLVLASAVERGAAGGVDVAKLLGAGPAREAGSAVEAGSEGEIVIEEIGSEGEGAAVDGEGLLEGSQLSA